MLIYLLSLDMNIETPLEESGHSIIEHLDGYLPEDVNRASRVITGDGNLLSSSFTSIFTSVVVLLVAL